MPLKNDAGRTVKGKEADIQKIVNGKTARAYNLPEGTSKVNEYPNTIEYDYKNKKESGRGTVYKDPSAHVPQFKKGGTVKATGLAKVHKGEKVLTKKQARKYSGGKKA